MEHTFNPYEAREDTKCKNRRLKVNGRGIVQAEPDLAVLSLSVVTKDKNPQAAQNLNDEISKQLINALLQIGIAEEDIKTISYTIYPEYDYIEGQQILRGYNVTHTLEVKVRDMDKVGIVINVAVQNGANQINSVQFTLEDSKYYYNRALKLAVKDAAQKAQAITSVMNVSFDSIPCSITEQSTSFTPYAEASAMKLAAAQAVMPGRIEITAAVEAEFEYKV